MSTDNARIRRELSCGDPGPYDMTQQVMTVTHTVKKPETQWALVAGVWTINEGDGWRYATSEEIKRLIGDHDSD